MYVFCNAIINNGYYVIAFRQYQLLWILEFLAIDAFDTHTQKYINLQSFRARQKSEMGTIEWGPDHCVRVS